jgi:dipeptidyl aminopeptidase/acylaminoacyl peptidase
MNRIISICSLVFLSVFPVVKVGAEESGVPELPVETFFKNPEFRSFRISPNGKMLAVLAPWEGVMNLYTMDLETGTPNVVTGRKDDIGWFSWINNDRIIYRVSDPTDRQNKNAGALYGVNIDGSQHNIIVDAYVYQNDKGATFKFEDVHYLSRYKKDPTRILVSSNKNRELFPDLYLMDPIRGYKSKNIYYKNPDNYNSFMVDENDVPRIAYKYTDNQGTYDDGSSDVYYRKDSDSDWELLFHFDDRDKVVEILDISGDKLLVSTNVDRDKMALYIYDLKKHKMGDQPICDDSVYDVDPIRLFRSLKTDRVVGIAYDAAKPKNIFFYKKYEQLQSMIDQALPDTYNSIVSNDDDGKIVVIASYSDIQFPVYYLLYMDTLQIEKIGEGANWLKPEQMCHIEPIEYKARDGRTIHGYLTLPKSWKKGHPVPFIINPHGGPWARDTWGITNYIDNEQQFYANRGFAFLRVNYRGSTGYGLDHLTSSYKHIDKMQEDVIDGVLWAIDQGYADKSCIGILGASAGGYSTMYGITKRPDLFTFGMNWMGVVDIPKHMYRYKKWERDAAYNHWVERFGDPDDPEERKLLEEWSPINYIQNIKCPLFIYHGLDDYHVHIEQEYELVSELKKYNKEYVEILRKNEIHSAFDEENRIKTYQEVDKFLKRFKK